jgi:hypothetical protein
MIEEGDTMTHFRGIMLLAAGCLAFYQGWKIHTGSQAIWAYGLGLLAVAIGVWRLTRKPDRPLR